MDTEYYDDFHIDGANIQTVGVQECANFKILDFFQSEEAGISFTLQTEDNSYQITSPLSGFFQAYNLSQAFATGIVFGLLPQKMIQSISKIDSIPGRWHFIKTKLHFSVLIDKANTPIALKNILPVLENMNYQRRILVFGNLGAGADSTERRMMAKLFYSTFHEIIVTSDDPEEEDPLEGAMDFLSGISQIDPSRITIELDRKKAIQLALNKAKNNDLVAILGRGNQLEFLEKGISTEFNDIEITTHLIRVMEKKNENSQ